MKRKNLLLIAAIILLIILMIAKCNCHSNKLTTARFVQPPIPAADVPFSDYSVDAAKGDTIMYPSGTVLLFPPDAFVDKKGKVVKGKVDVKYREFSNPVDYFLSGIPMGYDSAGVHYTFESAGMCDIQAFKDGQPVFVNKSSKPEINIATGNKDLAQNLYYLDTATKQWVNRGKSEILEVGKTNMSVKNPLSTESKAVLPAKPYRMADDLPIIKVRIDTASFKELMVYDKLQFQLDKDEKRFKPEDSDGRWEDIKLIKGSSPNIYTIRFSQIYGDNKKSVEYRVKPVLNDEDYAKAMLLYDKKMKEYERNIDARIAADNANKGAYIKDSINNAQIDRENDKTAQLNRIIEAKNAETDKINADIEAKNLETKNFNMSLRTLRNFQIDGFGIWNCDMPMPPENPITLEPIFLNETGDLIELYTANLFIRKQNTMYMLYSGQIEIPRNQESMIVGVCDGCFAYITYDEVKKLNISAGTKTQNFPMHIVSKVNNNYDFIKSIVSQ